MYDENASGGAIRNGQIADYWQAKSSHGSLACSRVRDLTRAKGDAKPDG